MEFNIYKDQHCITRKYPITFDLRIIDVDSRQLLIGPQNTYTTYLLALDELFYYLIKDLHFLQKFNLLQKGMSKIICSSYIEDILKDNCYGIHLIDMDTEGIYSIGIERELTDIILGFHFPENDHGDKIQLGLDFNYGLVEIVVDKNKKYQTLPGYMLLSLTSIVYNRVTLSGVKGKFQILGVYVPDVFFKALHLCSMKIKYQELVYAYGGGGAGLTTMSDLQNQILETPWYLDNLQINITYNQKYAVKIIEKYYLQYRKRKIFEKWKEEMKLVHAELRSLPEIGIEYFQAQEHFYSNNS